MCWKQGLKVKKMSNPFMDQKLRSQAVSQERSHGITGNRVAAFFLPYKVVSKECTEVRDNEEKFRR